MHCWPRSLPLTPATARCHARGASAEGRKALVGFVCPQLPRSPRDHPGTLTSQVAPLGLGGPEQVSRKGPWATRALLTPGPHRLRRPAECAGQGEHRWPVPPRGLSRVQGPGRGRGGPGCECLVRAWLRLSSHPLPPPRGAGARSCPNLERRPQSCCGPGLCPAWCLCPALPEGRTPWPAVSCGTAQPAVGAAWPACCTRPMAWVTSAGLVPQATSSPLQDCWSGQGRVAGAGPWGHLGREYSRAGVPPPRVLGRCPQVTCAGPALHPSFAAHLTALLGGLRAGHRHSPPQCPPFPVSATGNFPTRCHRGTWPLYSLEDEEGQRTGPGQARADQATAESV